MDDTYLDKAPGPGADLGTTGRQPPQNLDAERAIIGAALLDREAVALAREHIEGHEFYRKEHRLIFEAMCRLYEEDQAVDVITVAEALARDGRLESTGGADYLDALRAATATAANVVYHARIVREKSILRRLITASNKIAAEAFAGGDEAGRILDRAQTEIYSISERAHPSGFEPVDAIIPATYQAIEEAYQRKGELTGLRTHFNDLDRMTGGLQKSDLLVLAARPSMGKTSLALNLAYNVAVREGKGVAIFSLEMAKEQLVMRMLCSSAGAGFDLHDVRRGKIKPEDWPRLTDACGRLARAPIYIDDSSDITVLEMKSKARRLDQQYGLGLIIIDYLQLMSMPGKIESRQQEISTISRGLKGLAKGLKVPVLALSQLSRAVEQRGEHKPILSDLRESGSIEQDADVVMFIYREEVYKPEDESVRNLATIIIGKQRNGPIGTFELHFHKRYTRFDNLAR